MQGSYLALNLLEITLLKKNTLDILVLEIQKDETVYEERTTFFVFLAGVYIHIFSKIGYCGFC